MSNRDGHYLSLKYYLDYYSDQVATTLERFETRHVTYGRDFRIDLSRIAQFALYNEPEPEGGYYLAEFLESDPFAAAEELEGLTGVRIANNEDPVWLLSQHKQYKQATLAFGEHSTFAAYMQRRFPERLFDPNDPLGQVRAERKRQEKLDFIAEMEAAVVDSCFSVASKTQSSERSGDEPKPVKRRGRLKKG